MIGKYHMRISITNIRLLFCVPTTLQHTFDYDIAYSGNSMKIETKLEIELCDDLESVTIKQY